MTAADKADASVPLVPLPNSSTSNRTGRFALEWRSATAIASASAAKADRPSAGLSPRGDTTRRSEKKGTLAEVHGTMNPELPSNTEAAMDRMRVDFPLILGAVSRETAEMGLKNLMSF